MHEKHSNDMFRISMVFVYFESFELTNDLALPELHQQHL